MRVLALLAIFILVGCQQTTGGRLEALCEELREPRKELLEYALEEDTSELIRKVDGVDSLLDKSC